MPKSVTFDNAEVVAMCRAHEAACQRLRIPVSDAASRSRVAELIVEQSALGIRQQHVLEHAAISRFRSSANPAS